MNDKEGRNWLLQKLYDRGFKYIFYAGGVGGYLATKQPPKIKNNHTTYLEGSFERIDVLSDLIPDFNEPNYLDIGKYLGIIDWSKIPVDTPIKVQRENGVVINRHFATFDNGEVYYYRDGRTSWSDVGRKSVQPKKVILVGGDDEN